MISRYIGNKQELIVVVKAMANILDNLRLPDIIQQPNLLPALLPTRLLHLQGTVLFVAILPQNKRCPYYLRQVAQTPTRKDKSPSTKVSPTLICLSIRLAIHALSCIFFGGVD